MQITQVPEVGAAVAERKRRKKMEGRAFLSHRLEAFQPVVEDLWKTGRECKPPWWMGLGLVQ